MYPIYNHNWRNISPIYIYDKTSIKRNVLSTLPIYRGADKSLARPGRNKLQQQKILMFIYPIYHNWRNISTIYFFNIVYCMLHCISNTTCLSTTVTILFTNYNNIISTFHLVFQVKSVLYYTMGWELVLNPSLSTHTPQVQNYAAKHRPRTRQNICESPRVISVKHSSVLPDYGSHGIRNMLEWLWILCVLNFYTT